MAYSNTNWKDHVTNPDHTYQVTTNPDGTVKAIRTGTVLQQGTSMNAANFNNMESGILAADLTAMEIVRVLMNLTRRVDSEAGVIINATLTNTSAYPFNNSQMTIPIPAASTRLSTDYTVLIEVVSSAGGMGVGDIVVSGKLTNGFKVAYTGSATSVQIRCYVQGGRY